MRFELPDCHRCCLCVPLRHGVLIFGYLNLIFTTLVLTLEIIIALRPNIQNMNFLYRGVAMTTDFWLMSILYGLEVVFDLVLLVGAHRKDSRLIRAYYYYGIATTLATFLVYLVVRRDNQFRGLDDPFEFALAFSGLVLNCYLLLLIRTELKKVRYQTGQFRYVNHAEVVTDPAPLRDGLIYL